MHHDLQRQLAELKRIRTATITHLRRAFAGHGFNVADCADDQLSRAVLDAATLEMRSSADLFAGAFKLLHGRHTSPDARRAIASGAEAAAARAMSGRM